MITVSLVSLASRGSPKDVLNAHHGPTAIQNKHYYTWHNGARVHERKYKSIFVCPKTAGIFRSGKYGEAINYVEIGEQETITTTTTTTELFFCKLSIFYINIFF